jgi:hypothetical protein
VERILLSLATHDFPSLPSNLKPATIAPDRLAADYPFLGPIIFHSKSNGIKKTISMAPCGSGRKATFACAFVSDRRAYGPNNHYIFSANRWDSSIFAPSMFPLCLVWTRWKRRLRFRKTHNSTPFLRRRFRKALGSPTMWGSLDFTILLAPHNRHPGVQVADAPRGARPVNAHFLESPGSSDTSNPTSRCKAAESRRMPCQRCCAIRRSGFPTDFAACRTDHQKGK